MNALSVILHCDLDCFYAQVERERLRLPADAAVAVVQWQSTLAVSYPARKYGIKRGSTVEDIHRLTPSEDAVTIVHVETISNNTQQESNSGELRQNNEKVSLERYRRASAHVFTILCEEAAKLHHSTVLERASIDEAYIDVSAEVDKRLHCSLQSSPPPFSSDTHIIGSDSNSTAKNEHHSDGDKEFDETASQSTETTTATDSDIRLAYGAAIASHFRQRVLEECHFTLSAGISVNKLMSKFASAVNKPNQQTVVPISAISSLLLNTPVTRLRGLGGKLGQFLNEKLKVTTAGEALRFTEQELARTFEGDGKAAHLIWRSVRGMDDTVVTARNAQRSLLAAKSFKPEMRLDSIVENTWLPLLARELEKRMREEEEALRRVARTLTVGFRGTRNGQPPFVAASRSVPMPDSYSGKRDEEIAKLAMGVLRKSFTTDAEVTKAGGFKDRFMLPISFLGLTACNFLEADDEQQQISRFFSSGSGNNGGGEEAAAQPRMDVDREKEHERRLQEKADREFARQLHRQESLKGVRHKPLSKTTSKNKSGSKKSGVATLDQFFKKPK